MSEESEYETFRTALFFQIASRDARELAIDPRPAVYAWYRDISLRRYTGSPESFRRAILRLLNARLSSRFAGRLGYLYRVSVHESGGRLSPRSQVTLAEVCQHPDAVAELCRVLELAAPLQAPLYVGKTRNLRRRTGEHVSGATPLRAELRAAGLGLENCLLRFAYTDDPVLWAAEDNADRDPISLLIEELLTRLGPAAFVRRPG